jgi:hypothetical protein
MIYVFDFQNNNLIDIILRCTKNLHCLVINKDI